MRTCLTVLLIAATVAAPLSAGERPTLSVRSKELAHALSWASVAEECHWFWWVSYQGEAAEQLVQIGKPATPALLDALLDGDRAVAAHLILCSIYPSSGNCSGVIDDTALPFRYRFGKLEFTSESRERKNLSREMLIANHDAWRSYLAAEAVQR